MIVVVGGVDLLNHTHSLALILAQENIEVNIILVGLGPWILVLQ